jgi:hypothetical protein
MKIFNNTPNEIGYNISAYDAGNCGSLEPSQTVDLPAWDNKKSVTVSFQALPPERGLTPFSITIPKSGTGMAVTIGVYQE